MDAGQAKDLAVDGLPVMQEALDINIKFGQSWKKSRPSNPG
jgi:hypothetical protein